MRWRTRPVVAIAIACVVEVAVHTQTRPATLVQATVIRVTDGDTLTVRSTGRQRTIRIDGIDAPELRQPFGPEAREALTRLTLNRQVGLLIKGSDRRGRTLARVRAGGRDVSESLVESGLAWYYKAYSEDGRLAELHRRARQQRLGLWRDPAPIAPWVFRAPSPAATAGPVHGNVRSRVVHSVTCPDYDCLNCTQAFQSVAKAIAAGYRPHRSCIRID